MTSLIQYTERKRTRLASGGIGTDPRVLIQELFKFFHEEMDDLDAEWVTRRDPLTEEKYQATDAFRVINRHSRIHVMLIQLEF